LADLEPTIEKYDATDGYRLFYRHWKPADSPRARIVCLHGIQSHSGWYLHSSSRLCEAGFEVFFLDRRGSGLNTESRGHVDNFQILLDDLVLFLSRVRITEPRRPVVLIGVSWGGKLAVALAKEHPQFIDAMAMVCPGLFPVVDPSWLQKVRIALARVYYRYRHFRIPLNDPGLFTATPQWLNFLRADALSLHRATAAMLVASRRLDWFVRNAPERITMPIMLMLAGKDRILDNAKTRSYFERFVSRHKRLLEYPQAHHTLEFEPDPEPFIHDLTSWLSEVTASVELTRAGSS
jgi:alpha-beta hydrolase superfamily lysophospholipase